MASQPPNDTTYFPKGVAASGPGGRKATFFYDGDNNRAVLDVTDRDNLANLRVQSSKPGNLDVNIAGNLSVTGTISGPSAATVVQDPVSLRVYPIDEGTVAGNARGVRSTDFQINRAMAAQVASGQDSGLLGGESNTASGARSAVVGGLGSTATTDNAAAIGGAYTANTALNGFWGGGYQNAVSGVASAGIGGQTNVVAGERCGALAGTDHTFVALSARCGTVGGDDHTINASCTNDAALGGQKNTFSASVANSATAGGNNGTVGHNECLLLAFNNGTASATDNEHEFKVHSAATATEYAAHLQTGAASGLGLMGTSSGWVHKGVSETSSAASITDFVPVPGMVQVFTGTGTATCEFEDAANIIAAGYIKTDGDGYWFTVSNRRDDELTLTDGGGVTFVGTVAIPAGQTAHCYIYANDVTPTSEALVVQIVGVSSGGGGGTLAQTIAASVAATEPITLLGDLSQDGGDVSVVGAGAVAATDAGGDVILTGGAGGSTSGACGNITLTSGGSSAAVNTGSVTIQTANKTSGAANSGNLTLQTGTNSVNSEATGSVTIQSGNATGSSMSTGSVAIRSGNPTGGGGPSGGVSLLSGDASYTATSGSCTVGTGTSVRGSTSGLTLRTGAITNNNGGVRTTGSIAMTTGSHGGNGSGGTGSITISTGADNTGDESGNITLVTGTPGSGADTGFVLVSTGSSSVSHASLHPGHVYLRPGSVGSTLTSAHAVGEVVVGGSQTNVGRHLIVQQATAPTVTNGAKTTGFSELSDAAGTITATGANVTVTFAHAYEAPPHVCVTYYTGGVGTSVELDEVFAGSFRVVCASSSETFTYIVIGGTPHA